MIVRTKGENGAAGEREAYRALHCTEDDEWVPLSGDPAQSSHEAVTRCTQHIGAQLAKIRRDHAEHLRAIERNLSRLLCWPGPDDVIRIKGQVCELDDDGAVTIPALPKLRSWRRQLGERVDLIDDEVYKLLRRAMKLRGRRERASVTMIDHALEMPFDLLVRVADTEPNELGTVAEFMVRLYRAAESSKSATADTDECPTLPGGAG